MGLDIFAYSCVSFVEVLPDDEAWEAKYADDVAPIGLKTDFVTATQDHPERLAPLFAPQEGVAVYKIDGEELSFRVGRYSFYNWWREQLSMMANGIMPEVLWRNRDRAEVRKLPFYLLIDFSDCSGAIGATAARILAQEFAQFHPQADQHPDDDFRDVYAEFRTAFELASFDGFVKFT